MLQFLAAVRAKLNPLQVDCQCSQQVFHVAKQVEDSLAQRDLSICMNWVADNRSKLHRLNSTFEVSGCMCG